ncbi:MAG: hypothetical protein II982_00850 [Clostridia bacterium]|nr:hypothetical protein [Clostridia bacterium]
MAIKVAECKEKKSNQKKRNKNKRKVKKRKLNKRKEMKSYFLREKADFLREYPTK